MYSRDLMKDRIENPLDKVEFEIESSSPFKEIKTVGDLRYLIKRLSDNTPVMVRNGPLPQVRLNVVKQEGIYVEFQ